MRKLQFTVEELRDYYHGDFSRDLRRYFTIKPACRAHDYHMILHMAFRFNKSRYVEGCPALMAKYDVQTERNFMFCGIFYFILSIPQHIRTICGKNVEMDFYRCTGWPFASAGLGGSLPPKQMLAEASLLPCKAEEDNYYAMLNVVAPFMIHEFSEFLLGLSPGNINNEAYNRFRVTISDHVLSLINRIGSDAKEFANSFKPPLCALRGDIYDLDESKYDAAVVFVHGGFNGLDCLLHYNNKIIEASKIGYVI